MTPKQAAVLQAIRDLMVDGVPPSYSQIQARVGFSSISQVHRAIMMLVQHGRVTIARGVTRSLKIVEGPTREEMERWSDEEIARVGYACFEIEASRSAARRAAA